MNAAPTELRIQLREAGFDPIPLRGKNPAMKEGWAWHKLAGAGADQIGMWSKSFPDANNSGILCSKTHAFDIDILHPEAAQEIEDLTRERYEERGVFLVRIGRAPKRAILFRTDKPFDKIVEKLIAPDGSEQKLEFLADGQQLAAFVIHPDTRRPYVWHGGEPGEVRWEDLPAIYDDGARGLVDDAIAILERHGYRRKIKPPKPTAPDGTERADWSDLIANVIDHDALTSLGAVLVRSGMHEGAAVNLMRALVDAAPGDPAEPFRKMRRLGEIPSIVSSGAEKFARVADAPAPPLVLCAPYVSRDPATLPRRGWIYGKHYIRQYVSASIGEGGIGKSTVALTEAVIMIVRRPLLGKLPSAPEQLRVWYWNGEDPKPEIELRLAAICQRFGVDGRQLEGRLFIDGRDSPISIAAMNRSGALQLDAAVIQAITERLKQNSIDVLMLDPFVACHRVSENDNMAIDQVIKALGRIAEEANCAIDIDHHTRKPSPGQEGLTISDTRGGSAIVNGVRSGRIFNQMTSAEADKASRRKTAKAILDTTRPRPTWPRLSSPCGTSWCR